MTMVKERLVSLLRRRHQPALPAEDRAEIDQELQETAKQAGPPQRKAEKRPRARSEKRG